MVIYNTYDRLANLIATLPSATLISLKPSLEESTRFEYLVNKSKELDLEVFEKDELDHYIVLERLMRLAKIRASVISNG